MADLILTDDHKQYQDLARDFSQNEIAPQAHQFDHSGETPMEIYKKAWEIGLFNVQAAEEFGGLALGTWDTCVMAEEIGAACIGIGSTIWANDLAVAYVMAAGSRDQQKRLLEPLLSTFSFAGHAFNNTAGSYEIHYQKRGDSFVLNGTLPSINSANAAWITLVAEDKETEGSTTVFAVPTDAEGYKPGKSMPRVGMKAADLRVVELENVTLSAANVLGTTGGAEQIVAAVTCAMAPVIAAYAVGLMRSALENSVVYSKQRFSMGQPIANHQAVGFMLADLAKDCDAARLVAWKSAWLRDQNAANMYLSQQALTFACDAAMRGTTDAVQVYGGYGYSREYPVEKLMRDAKTLQLLSGGGTHRKVELGRQLVSAGR